LLNIRRVNRQALNEDLGTFETFESFVQPRGADFIYKNKFIRVPSTYLLSIT
jgi:hypothetical protein